MRGRTVALATLALFAALFLVLYVALAQSARFVPDDLCLFASTRKWGVLGTEWQLYTTWSGRWASNLIVAAVMSTLSDARSSYPFSLAALAYAVLSTWVVARVVWRDAVRAAVLPLLALVTVALLFYATPHRGDSWFFVFCAIENLVPLCCALLALACVLRADAHPRLAVPAALLAAISTAGHESVALSALFLGGLGLALGFVVRRDDPRLARGAVVLAVALASFAVSAASPGSAARLDQLPRAPLHVALRDALTGGPQVLRGVAEATPSALLATLATWTLAALVFAPERATALPPRRVLGVVALLLVAAFGVAVAASFPGYYALGTPPPERGRFVLAFFLIGGMATLGVALGGVLRAVPGSAPAVVAAVVLAASFVGYRQTVRMLPEIQVARRYAAAYDARIATILAARRPRDRSTIFVDPLPSSGPLRSAELDPENPRAYANRCLKNYLRLLRPILRRTAATPPRTA
ncbi:MAG TPA: DUF6056 family protein [Candidatus Binatia bacterium]